MSTAPRRVLHWRRADVELRVERADRAHLVLHLLTKLPARNQLCENVDVCLCLKGFDHLKHKGMAHSGEHFDFLLNFLRDLAILLLNMLQCVSCTCLHMLHHPDPKEPTESLRMSSPEAWPFPDLKSTQLPGLSELFWLRQCPTIRKLSNVSGEVVEVSGPPSESTTSQVLTGSARQRAFAPYVECRIRETVRSECFMVNPHVWATARTCCLLYAKLKNTIKGHCSCCKASWFAMMVKGNLDAGMPWAKNIWRKTSTLKSIK